MSKLLIKLLQGASLTKGVDFQFEEPSETRVAENTIEDLGFLFLIAIMTAIVFKMFYHLCFSHEKEQSST